MYGNTNAFGKSLLTTFVGLLTLLLLSGNPAKPANVMAAVSMEMGRNEGDLTTVVIYFKEQPLHDHAPAIQAEYRPQILAISEELQSLYEKLEIAQLQTPGALEAEQIQDLQSKISIRSIQLEDSLQDMRGKLIRAARPATEAAQADTVAWLESTGANVHYRMVVVNAVVATLATEQLAALKARPEVASVSIDRILTAQLDHSYYAIKTNGWITTPGGTNWEPAIIDTGVDTTHPALSAINWVEKVCLEAAGNPAHDNTSDDVQGHGTSVTGPLASTHNLYTGIGYAAMDSAFNLKAGYLITTTNGNEGTMHSSDALACVDWALTTQPDPPDVFNLSYGGCDAVMPDYDIYEMFWDAVIEDLLVPVTLTAGNYKELYACTRNVTSPGRAYNALTVGSINDYNDATYENPHRENDVIANYSGLGPTPAGRRKPDIVAPGTAILTTNHTWEEEFGVSDDFVEASGTSIAAPHVAGALLRLEKFGITDPILQKALLINSAEDKGDIGWDAAYGWGYLDLSKAWETKSYLVSNTILPNPAYNLYQGKCNSLDKSTLVWNLKVDYNGDSFPTTYYPPVSDLDLYVFDEWDNSVMDSDTTTIDNVQQTTCPYTTSGNAVIKVDAYSPSFARGPSERYALATSQNFVMSQGPVLQINPGNYLDHCVGEQVEITLPIENTGDLLAHQVNVTASVPTGLQLVSGSNPYAINGIWDGLSSNVYWTFQLDAPGLHVVPVSAVSNSYGETVSDSENLYIEALTTPQYPLLTYPGNGTTVFYRTPTFTWNSPTMARYYKIQIDDDEGFISPEIDQWVDTNSFTPLSDMDLGTYYWRVYSWNVCDISTASSVWTVTIEEGNQVYLPLVIR